MPKGIVKFVYEVKPFGLLDVWQKASLQQKDLKDLSGIILFVLIQTHEILYAQWLNVTM